LTLDVVKQARDALNTRRNLEDEERQSIERDAKKLRKKSLS